DYYAYVNDCIDDNLFIFICNCNPNVNAEKVEKELLKIIDKLKMGKISQKDLQRVKNNVKSDFIFSLNNASAVANIYGSYLARGDINPLLNYEKDIQNLELKDLISCAKKYFIQENSTTVILRKDSNG
ncbi:insulinase family protein, partial [Campylobacter jejuni]|nr:insulinase family protein [Campylobacter jejuni]